MVTWQLNIDRSRENVEDPLGFRFAATDSEETQKQQRDMKGLRLKRADELGKRPAAGIFQTGFMLFMSGSSLNIISIIITGMAMWTPIRALLSFKSVFAPVDGDDISLFWPKLKYLGLNLVMLLMGVYKVSIMGLLPVLAEDWISLIPVQTPLEIAFPTVPAG